MLIENLGRLSNRIFNIVINYFKERIKMKKRIIIIGAGIAGLSAAKKIIESDHDVLILEAKNIIGGRIESTEIDGSFFEVGANWQEWSKNNPIEPILKKLVAEKEISLIPDSLKSKNTYKINVSIFDFDKRKYLALDKNLIYYNKFIDENIKYSEGLDLDEVVTKQPKYHSCSYISDKLINMSNCGVEVNNLVVGGYIKVCNELVKQIKEIAKNNNCKFEIKLNNEATKIKETEDNKFKCTTKNKNTFTSDYVICTIPIESLKNKLSKNNFLEFNNEKLCNIIPDDYTKRFLTSNLAENIELHKQEKN